MMESLSTYLKKLFRRNLSTLPLVKDKEGNYDLDGASQTMTGQQMIASDGSSEVEPPTRSEIKRGQIPLEKQPVI